MFTALHVSESLFTCAQLTWADLSLVTFWDIGEAFHPDTYQTLRDKYPALAAHAALVCAEPRVKAYRDKHRPLTLDLSGC